MNSSNPSNQTIPFLDLKIPHKELEEELIEVFRDCLRNASFIGGPNVQAFEEEFARFCEVKYCVGVNSGTDALRFALIACGIGPGDEVITVPNTFIATTEAISQVGATPAFVDIDERTYNMDPNKLEDYLKKRTKEEGSRKKEKDPKDLNSESFNLSPLSSNLSPNASHSALCSMRSASHPSPLTPNASRPNGISAVPQYRSTAARPKAVIPVHLYGQPADMDSILKIARRYDLIVIEDACQAHGALYHSSRDDKWKKAGSMGLAGAFSFYPGKNLGACGEGGAVTTNNEEIARKVRMLRDHGQNKKYYHEMEGYNGRLDAIQAGILRIKLRGLSERNEKRRQNASLYAQHLNSLNTKHSTLNTENSTLNTIVPPFEPSWARAVYHLYVIRAPRRDDLQKYLAERNIATGLHYPIPLHLQKAYSGNGYKEGQFPISEKVAAEILSLPMYPELTDDQIKYVVERIKQFYA